MTSFTILMKRVLPQGLLGRSLMILVTPLLLVQLISAAVFYTSHWDAVSKRLALGVAGDIRAVMDLHRLFPESQKQAEIIAIAGTRMDLSVKFEEKGVLPENEDNGALDSTKAALSRALTERLQAPFRIDTTTYRRHVIVEVLMAEGVMEIIFPKKRLYSYTTGLFLAWMTGSSMLLMSIAMVFMRNQVRSVRRLAQAANNLGKGRDVTDFKAEGAREVRQAAAAFAMMQERISRQIEQRTGMLAGVSHDLRTPLTRMKLQLAMMEQVDGAQELAEDVAEMEQMIAGYLAFVRGEGTEKPEQGDLAALVDDVIAGFERAGNKVERQGASQLALIFRPQVLARAVANLIGNALRYGKRVVVSVNNLGDVAEILVDDDGPGIPIDKRQDVFRPFLRLEESRNSETGGIGLGLSIARDVVRGHGGEILLDDSPLGGLRVRVRLPV